MYLKINNNNNRKKKKHNLINQVALLIMTDHCTTTVLPLFYFTLTPKTPKLKPSIIKVISPSSKVSIIKDKL